MGFLLRIAAINPAIVQELLKDADMVEEALLKDGETDADQKKGRRTYPKGTPKAS